MLKPDQSVLEALARIGVQEPKFIEWMRGRLNVVTNVTIQERDDTTLRMAQGRAQELADILAFIQQAPELLNKRRT